MSECEWCGDETGRCRQTSDDACGWWMVAKSYWGALSSDLVAFEKAMPQTQRRHARAARKAVCANWSMPLSGIVDLPMERSVDAEHNDLSFRRASGDCVCDVCGKPYWKHPDATEPEALGNVDGDGLKPFLTRLCNGDLVKL